MSVISFLKNLWNGFKNLFNRVENYVRENIHTAVITVENIKLFVDSPFTDFLTAVIPGDIDDVAKRKLREYLPKVLLSLQIVKDCAELEDEERILCIAEKIAAATSEQKDVIFHNIAVLLMKHLSDGRFTFSDSIGLIEWYYRNHIKQ